MIGQFFIHFTEDRFNIITNLIIQRRYKRGQDEIFSNQILLKALFYIPKLMYRYMFIIITISIPKIFQNLIVNEIDVDLAMFLFAVIMKSNISQKISFYVPKQSDNPNKEKGYQQNFIRNVELQLPKATNDIESIHCFNEIIPLLKYR